MTIAKVLTADYRAMLFFMHDDLKRWLLHCWCTMLSRVVWRTMGIKYGKGLSVNGSMQIRRFKYSQIIIGDNCTFNSNNLFNTRGIGPCIIRTYTDFAKIEIGNNTGMSGASINCRELIKIGNNVKIGAGVKIGDNDDHDDILDTKQAPVIIEDDVFIGMNSIVLKGVTIEKGTIIGAGSVVTKSIPAGVVAAGNPCKVIRQK